MVASSIPAELRILVSTRADNRCEYCLISQSVALYRHEPDHIIPRQHGGQTSADNLALACLRCNRYKGPNIGSIDPLTGHLAPFFNPRTQEWTSHFRLEGALICPLSPEARVTRAPFDHDDGRYLRALDPRGREEGSGGYFAVPG